MDNYREELMAMGINPFDETGAINNAMNLGNSLLKRRRSVKSEKAAQLGLDQVEASFSDEEGIHDSILSNVQNIKNQSYENQFREAAFAENMKQNKYKTQLLQEEVEGSWLDDFLGLADLGIGLADVTGLGALAENAVKSLFKSKARGAG